MRGMNATTGKALDGTSHILQSVRDIITTKVGTRVMLRNYGSRLPELIDRPMNTLFDIELQASVGEALAKWEPRFKLTSVTITSRTAQGRVVLSVAGTIAATGAQAQIDGITL